MNSTTPTLDQYPSWKEKLVEHLRRLNVATPIMGDILAEIDSHLADSGDGPERAFGSPMDYAESRGLASIPSPKPWWQHALRTIGLTVGSWLLIESLFSMGTNRSRLLLPELSNVVVLVLGLVGIVIGILFARQDYVHDPRTGKRIRNYQDRIQSVLWLGMSLVFILSYFINRLLN